MKDGFKGRYMSIRKAIIVPYVVGQNEPSKPIAKIFDVPEDDTYGTMVMLSDLFKETFGVPVEKITISFAQPDDPTNHKYFVNYGDITVSSEEASDCFLYVTYLEE